MWLEYSATSLRHKLCHEPRVSPATLHKHLGTGGKGEIVVRIDPRYFRPAEVETLLGDPTKAHQKLGWTPTTTLEELVAEMVEFDQEEARKEALLRLKGFKVVGSMENPPTTSAAIQATRTQA